MDNDVILAIDPGSSGGFALMKFWPDCVDVWPMPLGMTAQIDLLRELACYPHIRAIIERVGFHRPGNSATATATFARHCGHLEAACYAFGIPVEQVAPQTWQKALGSLPDDKSERKRTIKEAMARRFPHLTVTLKTADALAILWWSKNKV